MSQDAHISEPIELTDELSRDLGVCFDPDNVVLQGVYGDEISAHRAKRMWRETLELNFLLDPGHDFALKVSPNLEEDKFKLTCHFLTACGRYAFWRITNNQAPEAQYVIETAHIPMCHSHHADIITAPDLRSVHEEPLILSGADLARLFSAPRRKSGLRGWLRRLLGRRG